MRFLVAAGCHVLGCRKRQNIHLWKEHTCKRKTFPLPSPTNPTDFFLRPRPIESLPPSLRLPRPRVVRSLTRSIGARACAERVHQRVLPLWPLSPLSPLCAPSLPLPERPWLTPRRRGEPRGVLAAAGPPLDGPKAPSPYSRIHIPSVRTHSLPHAPPPQLLFAHGGREAAEGGRGCCRGRRPRCLWCRGRAPREERRGEEGIKERGRGRERASFAK